MLCSVRRPPYDGSDKDFTHLVGIKHASVASPISNVCEPGDCSLMLALSCFVGKEEISRLMPAERQLLRSIRDNLPRVQRRMVEARKNVLEARAFRAVFKQKLAVDCKGENPGDPRLNIVIHREVSAPDPDAPVMVEAPCAPLAPPEKPENRLPTQLLWTAHIPVGNFLGEKGRLSFRELSLKRRYLLLVPLCPIHRQ